MLDSYTEVSPTGTGLKVFVRGVLPRGGNRDDDIEMYDHDRYFTVTGHHLAGTPVTVEERHEEVAVLHRRIFGAGEDAPPAVRPAPQTQPLGWDDEELLRRALASRTATSSPP
jgi:primase-polymerase (primpol)-like protein